MRSLRHHPDRACAAHQQYSWDWAVSQRSVCVRGTAQCVPLPCGRVVGTKAIGYEESASVVQHRCLWGLCTTRAMYRRAAPHGAAAAVRGSRCACESACQGPSGAATQAQRNGGASVRGYEVLDGHRALLGTRPEEGQSRDCVERLGLQPQACDEDPGGALDDACLRLNASRYLSRPQALFFTALYSGFSHDLVRRDDEIFLDPRAASGTNGRKSVRLELVEGIRRNPPGVRVTGRKKVACYRKDR